MSLLRASYEPPLSLLWTSYVLIMVMYLLSYVSDECEIISPLIVIMLYNHYGPLRYVECMKNDVDM